MRLTAVVLALASFSAVSAVAIESEYEARSDPETGPLIRMLQKRPVIQNDNTINVAPDLAKRPVIKNGRLTQHDETPILQKRPIIQNQNQAKQPIIKNGGLTQRPVLQKRPVIQNQAQAEQPVVKNEGSTQHDEASALQKRPIIDNEGRYM
ncbi:hypothetical protein B0H13DRAFT_2279077 [Mycena leptocephala]|nr:hypothetical protein B0H13DRAFT_2279077 [Mycena leptocephala]